MLTGIQFQHWDTKLQLPAMGGDSLSADAKGMFGGESPVLSNKAQQEDYPVHSLMAMYKKRWANTAELGCLYLLALFPYPVAKGVLLSTLSTLNLPTEKVVSKPKRSGYYPGAKKMLFSTLSNLHASTEKVVSKHEDSYSLYQLLGQLLQDGQPDADKLTQALHKLDDADLLSIEGEIVSVSRPVGAYFADTLKTHFFDDWRLQQQQLVYYYDDLAASAEDDEQRFWLNCKKLLHNLATTHKQQALDDIYRPDLSPQLAKQGIGTAGYQLRLHLLSGFFQQPWEKTDFCLNAETKGYVQAEAGQALYQLGEQQQALPLLDNAREVMVKAESWTAASELAHLLGQHASDQQNMPESIRCFRQSIDYAEQGQNTNVLLRRMRSLFQLYKKNGDIKEAGLIADKAKKLLDKVQQQSAKPVVATA